MASIKDRLESEGLLQRVVLGGTAEWLLSTLQIDPPAPSPSADEQGKVSFGLDERLLGFFDLQLVPPGSAHDYRLKLEGPNGARTAFRVAVSLHTGPAKPLFELVSNLPGHVLTGGQPQSDADGAWVEAIAGSKPQLVGTDVFLVVEGRVDAAACVFLSTNALPPDDVVTLALDPPAVLLGASGFALALPDGVTFDDSESAKAPGDTLVEGARVDTPADAPAWRGVVVRNAKLYLPKDVPLVGRQAVNAHVEIGRSPTPGIDLIVTARVPATPERPAIDVRIECRDPAATGLGSFVPTLVEAVMELPLDGREDPITGAASVRFAAGKPVRLRARYARRALPAGQPIASEFSLALESQGPAGLLQIDAAGGLGSRIAVTAGTVATALIADGVARTPTPDGDGSGVVLHTLLTAAVGLSSFLEGGELVLHRAELATSGGALPVGKALKLRIDYSVAATVTSIDIGVMSVQMKPNQPLRVRVREVLLVVDPSKSGLGMVQLDYARSSVEIEDPGGWIVDGPGSLFDVLGTRSGRGSLWVEVDLRFKIDLGPVKVSGATIRATLDAQGKLNGELRGIAASLALDPLITGDGQLELTEEGFHAYLAAQILPLRLGAFADVVKNDAMVKLALGVDLPGPLPLGNSGLAIYGIGGMFAANGRPRPPKPAEDPFLYALDWDYVKPDSFVPDERASSFGFEAVLGTAPDMGFTFSARTGIFITTPDVAVRGAVAARVLGERVRIVRSADGTRDSSGFGALEARGIVIVDPADGVTVAVEGTYAIPVILTLTIPIAARFPKGARDWYVHLGADGWTPPAGAKSEGREMGPVRAVVLPDLIAQQADAYLMFRGDGLTDWPRGTKSGKVGAGSFVAAFGFGFDITMGLEPVVWAEVFARADMLITTAPPSFVGLGTIGGSLHVGPFSVGVDAKVHVYFAQGQPPYLYAEVCGTVDYWLDEVRECVHITYNQPPTQKLPAPSPHPLDARDGPVLVDDDYRRLASMGRDRASGPVVWADAIPLLTFEVAPGLAVTGAQFPDAAAYPQGNRAKPLGGDLLTYDWTLTGLRLIDATNASAEKTVAGPLSAAWLDGKFGQPAAQPEPAELALLTHSGDLWFGALADGGKSLADSPLDARANLCRARVEARPGWAIGAGATPAGDGWRVPEYETSTDPLQSRVTGIARLLVASSTPPWVLTQASAWRVPAPYGFRTPRLHAFAPQELDAQRFERLFEGGGIDVPPARLVVLARRGLRLELALSLDTPIVQARLWFAVEQGGWAGLASAADRLRATDELDGDWLLDDERDLGNGWVAVGARPPHGTAIERVRVQFLAGARVGILGVQGLTTTAIGAAAQQNAATAAEAAKQKQAAAEGPPKTKKPGKKKRCVLEPGRTYRLEVDMSWSGALYKYDEQGTKQLVESGGEATTRSYWFRTAPLRTSQALPKLATLDHFAHTFTKRELFDAAMLQRHLRGYEPAQSELHRFADDPVRVWFRHGHVAALADAYGFELRCGYRRLDAPLAEEADRLVKPKLSWPGEIGLLTGAQQSIAATYLQSPCGLAPPGLVMTASAKLSRDCWYEVYVHANSKKSSVADGRLPGVTFRTSRWGTGAEMMSALQFPRVGAGRAHGGLALREDVVLQPTSALGEDAAFDALLEAWHFDGWPVAREPRVSLLWRPVNAAWCCVGVMIESPEPIHRPGRFHVTGIDVGMGSTQVPFDIVRRDRSGSRLLFATTRPFVPRLTRRTLLSPWRPPRLRLECVDLPIGRPAKPMQGWLEIPLRPSFAEEAA